MKRKPYKVHPVRRRTRRRWLWLTLGPILGIVVILGGLALGYYLWLDAKVSAANDRVSQEVHQALDDDPTGETDVTVAEAPDAMNILLLGSDTRSDTTEGSRSDTVILIHVDPSNDYLSMLSFPRDLRVEVEDHGTRKLNYAYSVGGPALTIRTIQQTTGVDIDHYLEVDFAAFGAMTHKLGGVYIEVDRRYYYQGRDYAKIDLDPGYQLLDGYNALDYVRYRHDANADFGRMERQQRYLNAVRQQAMGWDLALKLPGLVGTFFDYAATDLHTNDFLRLATWVIKLDGSRIRQVALRGDMRMSSGVTFVFWKPEDMAAAVESLLTPPGVEYASSESTVSASSSTTTSTAFTPSIPQGATPNTIPNSTIWKTVAKTSSLPIEAPSYVPKEYRISTRSDTYAYMYDIEVDGGRQPAVVMLYRHTGTGRAGEVKVQEEFINVTATKWLDAPAASPGVEVEYNGTVFTIVGTVGKVERIWWKRNGVLYWISNSLSRVASDAELLAMAQSMIPIPAQ